MVVYPADNCTAAPTYDDRNSTAIYIEYDADTGDECSVELSPQEKQQVNLNEMLANQRDRFNRHNRRKM